jgi:anaerobic carbon-monoxide dehydrogenase iron sulfur subunit
MQENYYKIIVDYDNCTGCRGCEVVCSLNMWGEINPNRSAIRNIRTEQDGLVSTIPVVCQQCQDAICEAVCPVEAISRNANSGALVIDKEKCLGCRCCVYSCPFGGVSLDPITLQSSKCDLCGGDPQCAAMCPKDALNFVRVDRIGDSKKRKSLDKYVQFLKISHDTLVPTVTPK